MNPLFANQRTSIFEHMSGLARSFGAINLGQGFPDFGWPEDVIDIAVKALASGSNQYPPSRGVPELRQAVCDHYAAHQGLSLCVDNIVVTSGATEAIASAIMALVSPGDEVLLFQPLYDAYLPLVRRCGGKARLARLEAPGWRLTQDLVEDWFSDRIQLVVFNNPHNPTGRAFGNEELALLAAACVRHDVVALVDEVWEQVTFDGRRHLPLAALPGMEQRTVKIGSAGKIFCMTGWKVGWAVAPSTLAKAIAAAHQFVTFTTPPNLQSAVAYGLGKEVGWFEDMRARFQAGRDRLATGLAAQGFVLHPSEGTYFICVDLPASGVRVDDVTFAERAVREAGVAAIPLSAFYEEEPVKHVVRLCFCKTADVIDQGIDRLAAARRLFETC